jgi:hypothetical protein
MQNQPSAPPQQPQPPQQTPCDVIIKQLHNQFTLHQQALSQAITKEPQQGRYAFHFILIA